MPTICETYARQPALHHLDKGQVVHRDDIAGLAANEDIRRRYLAM